MNGRVLPFCTSAHSRADLLLPWYVNGTLEREEQAFVAAHLRECARCRQEVEWLRALSASCAALRTEAERRSTAARVRSVARRELGGWRSIAAGVRDAWQRNDRWIRWSFALQFCAIVALGGALLAVHAPSEFRTLGSTMTAGAPADRATIVVVFDPALAETELRQVLRAADARIVDGPTQSDAYVLAVPQDRAAATIAMLKSRRAVKLAAPFGPMPSR